MFKSHKGRAAAGATIIAVLAVALGIGLAQGQDEAPRADDPTAARAKIKIGTYEHERVMQGYYKTQQLVARLQELERRFMAAQESGDSQTAFEIQMEAQQTLPAMEQELIQSYNAAIDKVMPDLAREHNLRAVVLEVIYSVETVEPEDITDAVIAAINEGADVPVIEPDPADDPQADDDDDDE